MLTQVNKCTSHAATRGVDSCNLRPSPCQHEAGGGHVRDTMQHMAC